MYRKWTSRKSTTLDETAIDKSDVNPVYTVHRADLEPVVARKQALRLLATYTFLWLPVHCGICWLASYSLGLAAASVMVAAAAAFAVALAKYLALEDLLQKLPLLIVLGLVFVCLFYLTSQPNLKWLVGAEFFGTLLILITLISVLGGLYRPMVAAYQTVTLKTPFRDLCVAAVAMLISLGLAALAQILPQFGFTLLMCAAAGSYSGLVVLEYAAWARANPNVSLERAQAFTEPTAVSGEPTSASKAENHSGTALLGTTLFGLGFGIVTVCKIHLSSPSPRLSRFLLLLTEKEPEKISKLFPIFFLLGIVAIPFGLYLTASSLNALKLANPLSGLRHALDALVVFLTYPETKHPLVHKVCTPWLRPVSVRMAVTGLALVTTATAFFSQPEKLPLADPITKSVAKASPPPTSPNPPFVGAQDAELARILGFPLDDVRARPLEQSPKAMPPAPAEQPHSDAGVPQFVLDAVAVVVGPPVFIYLMIWFVGLTVLPIHFNYFEQPQSQSPPA
jgi:hypothetical protein